MVDVRLNVELCERDRKTTGTCSGLLSERRRAGRRRPGRTARRVALESSNAASGLALLVVGL